jgi:hypothetical protein
VNIAETGSLNTHFSYGFMSVFQEYYRRFLCVPFCPIQYGTVLPGPFIFPKAVTASDLYGALIVTDILSIASGRDEKRDIKN